MEKKVEVVSKYIFRGVEYVEVFSLSNEEMIVLNTVDVLPVRRTGKTSPPCTPVNSDLLRGLDYCRFYRQPLLDRWQFILFD